MKDTISSLERKLNKIIDDEIEKDVSNIDDELIMACCDGLLRMGNVDRYIISESEMRKSINSFFGRKPKVVTRLSKQIKILLIAAIIILLLAIGSLGYAQYKYNIFTFSDFSTVLFSQSDHKRVNDLKVGYIPEGFSLNYESNNKFERSKEYVKGNDFFTVLKQSNGNRIDINTEYKIFKVTQIDGIDYVEFGEEEHGQGIVWEKDGYQYVMTGNIAIDELFKIAISIVYN